MRIFLYTAILFFILCFQTDEPRLLERGIYQLNQESYNLIHPRIKISGRNFKIYDYGHAGKSYYGWGTYKIYLKDSIIKFNYEEIHGSYFYPLRNHIKTETLFQNDDKLLIKGFTIDKSEDTFRNFDSLFTKCKSSVDISFENNKKRGRVEKAKKKDL